VVLRGAFGDEPLGDLPVGEAIGDELGHLSLAWAQRGGLPGPRVGVLTRPSISGQRPGRVMCRVWCKRTSPTSVVIREVSHRPVASMQVGQRVGEVVQLQLLDHALDQLGVADWRGSGQAACRPRAVAAEHRAP
jgi:hypothetical protein